MTEGNLIIDREGDGLLEVETKDLRSGDKVRLREGEGQMSTVLYLTNKLGDIGCGHVNMPTKIDAKVFIGRNSQSGTINLILFGDHNRPRGIDGALQRSYGGARQEYSISFPINEPFYEIFDGLLKSRGL